MVYLGEAGVSVNGQDVRQPLTMEGLTSALFGHAAFQYLNAACELGLFECVARRRGLTKQEIRRELGLAERATDILLLGCTALDMLVQRGDRYHVADLIQELMDGGTWQRIVDTVAFEQHIVYEGQHDFTESLRANSNVGLRRIPGSSPDLYRRLAETPRLEQVFYRYMRSWSLLANEHLVRELDLSGASRLLDCGGGDAVNSTALAAANPRLGITLMELPAAAERARRNIAEAGLSNRITVREGDFFTDPLPEGHDCVLFAHQLVIWKPEENVRLLTEAHRVLPSGGRVVVFNSMSNDAGDGPRVAALDSVYFASLPAEGGMIYSWAQHEESLRAAGFHSLRRLPCRGWTPHGILIGTK